ETAGGLEAEPAQTTGTVAETTAGSEEVVEDTTATVEETTGGVEAIAEETTGTVVETAAGNEVGDTETTGTIVETEAGSEAEDAVAQVSVVTFGNVAPAMGYTYTVTIDGQDYSVTVGEDGITEDFASILAGLAEAIELNGFTVEVDSDDRTLTITGNEDGTAFEVEAVAVTEVGETEVADAVGDEPVETTTEGEAAVEADPSTVAIDITDAQATDDAAEFSIVVAGLNGGDPIVVDVSGATDGESLAA